MVSLLSTLTTKAALAGAVGLVILYFVVNSIISYRRLRHIRGPWLASVSQLWIFNVTANGDLFLALEKVLQKYGSPARIGPNMIVTDDPEFVRTLTAPRSPYKRGHWYAAMRLDPRINNLLSEQDEKRHASLRAKMMPGYTGKEVPAQEAIIDERVTDLIGLIQREGCDKQAPVDFAKFASFFTLDALTHLAFGYPFGFLTKNEDLYAYNKTSSAFFPILELGTNVPLIYSILSSSFVQSLAGPKPEDKAGFGAIIGVAQKVVADRFNPASEKRGERDMLNSFIKHGLTQLEAESESLLQILAGSDSTATTIRVTFLYILTNPPVYAKLRAEIDEAVAAGKVSYPIVSNAEALELPYLQACIKEGLRLWQPLMGIETKLSPPEETFINGVRIPGGTQIGQCQHSMMRRKDFFGEDASVFRPERWIEGDEVTRRAYEKVWELSFSAGRFTCLGKAIALMELNKVFVELMRRFDWGIVNPVKPMKTRCWQIHVQEDMNLRVWARQN